MTIGKLSSRSPLSWTGRRTSVDRARLRVIVVDGSHKEALALCAHLSFVGMECRAVFGTVDAIDLGRGWVPHVILMDVSIAQYGGIDTVRMLRNDPRLRDCYHRLHGAERNGRAEAPDGRQARRLPAERPTAGPTCSVS
jgi:CheY-like chemotaxis protein